MVLVAIAALVTGVSVWFQKFPPSSATGDPSTDDATAMPASPPPPGALAQTPGGCIAGTGSVGAKSFLEAAAKAPHTTTGAVEVAGAYQRWGARSPWPTVAESEQVVKALAAPEADASITGLPKRMATLNAEGSIGDARLTLSDGRYIVESAARDDVVVSTAGTVIQNGQPVPDRAQTNTFTLTWKSGRWMLVSAHPTRSTEDLFTNGARFAGGC
ncbi:hypothetical protein [Tersicoccus sp. Bi-70]|uniref:hypothetical protein n=1 Tax=Tersicoccus sp. Bi-70 TaxID=1897634 RepID=UPI001180FFCA|nr:hypothetical protein [Tersicoccus sp. Bi-70]